MGMLTLCSLICERPFHCRRGSNLISAWKWEGVRRTPTQKPRNVKTQLRSIQHQITLHWTSKCLQVSTTMTIMQPKSALVGWDMEGEASPNSRRFGIVAPGVRKHTYIKKFSLANSVTRSSCIFLTEGRNTQTLHTKTHWRHSPLLT